MEIKKKGKKKIEKRKRLRWRFVRYIGFELNKLRHDKVLNTDQVLFNFIGFILSALTNPILWC